MIEWAVYREGEDWKIGAPAADVVLSGDHPAKELDEQLAQWGMDRSQLMRFESDELPAEFEAVFGSVGRRPAATASLDAEGQ